MSRDWSDWSLPSISVSLPGGLELLSNWISEVPAAGRPTKEKQDNRFESKLSNDFPASLLSLLSDSNQRPRDYKSRALANWAKEAGGQLAVSRRYNQVPLLCSHPGGFRGSWPYRTAHGKILFDNLQFTIVSSKAGAKVRISEQKTKRNYTFFCFFER